LDAFILATLSRSLFLSPLPLKSCLLPEGRKFGRMGRTWSNARGAGYSPVLERIYGLDKPEKRVHPSLGPPRKVSSASLPLLRRGDKPEQELMKSPHSPLFTLENRERRIAFLGQFLREVEDRHEQAENKAYGAKIYPSASSPGPRSTSWLVFFLCPKQSASPSGETLTGIFFS